MAEEKKEEQVYGGGAVMLPVKPDRDPEVTRLHEEALKLRAAADALVILTVEDLTSASNDVGKIRALKKALEGRRVEYVKPLNSHVDAINASFKIFMEPIKEADQITGDKILNYQNVQEARRREEERVNILKLEAEAAEAALKGRDPEPVTIIPMTSEAPKNVPTEGGTVGRRMVRKWNLEDMAKVPIEYMILNSKLVTANVKSGIPSIPGIHIYDEPVLTFRQAAPDSVESGPEELPFN